ncbi:MAG: hypothetical protein JEZ08_13350 [Clostridiales bacterium]|nr:hypothetical protein [Clostridiales bacterium]
MVTLVVICTAVIASNIFVGFSNNEVAGDEDIDIIPLSVPFKVAGDEDIDIIPL